MWKRKFAAPAGAATATSHASASTNATSSGAPRPLSSSLIRSASDGASSITINVSRQMLASMYAGRRSWWGSAPRSREQSGDVWEDLFDVALAREREHQRTERWAVVRRRLQRAGRLTPAAKRRKVR
ncbi:MAG TPA: hypothetical protein VFW66_10590 [Gemmatimonadales bacterium]|nr:hypothetical protein [Gemmatimonadales bacterium]